MPKGKPVDISNGTKWCAACQQMKALAEFAKSSRTVHGYWTYCKACSYSRHDEWRKKNLKKMAEDQKQRRWANPDRWHEYGLKKAYGMERGDFAKMLQTQNNTCAICKTPKPGGKGRFHVDHCHDTGVVRGLLCHHCNLGIGHFFHRTALLENAVIYLSTKRAVKSTG